MTGDKKTAQNVNPAARFFTTPAGISSASVDAMYQELKGLRQKKAGAKLGGASMTPTEASRLDSMERAADIMANARKRARAEKDMVERQKIYLKIADLAKAVSE
jgi:hypothetical protein